MKAVSTKLTADALKSFGFRRDFDPEIQTWYWWLDLPKAEITVLETGRQSMPWRVFTSRGRSGVGKTTADIVEFLEVVKAETQYVWTGEEWEQVR